MVYDAFFQDFGPLNLSKTHKFCIELDKLLRVSYKAHTRIRNSKITKSIITVDLVVQSKRTLLI